MDKIICNPLNLEYRYQYKNSPLNTAVFREAADPTMVLFKDTYFLFASMSGGFWYSEDLFEWQYKATPELPIYDYAPDVRVVNGGVSFCASKRGEKCGVYFSKDPLHEEFRQLSAPLTFWDPDIFQDDDGRIYLYWGCSSREPIWGIELDSKTMQPIGEKQALIAEHQNEHGWERVGDNNALAPAKSFGERFLRFAVGTKPCIEGAYMTKYGGRYYLQYATPWTQNNVYSDGVYIGESPLGPFTYQSHNPFSSKPGGYITAAGHGSTFQDKSGRWWHVSTMRISVNDDYERRIGLFPCEFDKDGVLHCNQSFADYPFSPEYSDEQRMADEPKWLLLSYKAQMTASSCQDGFEAAKAADENIQTWWAAETGESTEWLMMDLGCEKTVKAIQVNFADHKLSLPEINRKQMVKENIGYRRIFTDKQRTAYLLEGSTDGENWVVLRDNGRDDTDYAHDLVVLQKQQQLRYLRLSEMQAPMGGVIAISGLRVFGRAQGAPPEQVTQIEAQAQGELNIALTWQKAKDAIGYNVRYGIAPDKLYLSYQLYEKTSLNLSMINKGKPYYAAIDSFNDSGVTQGKTVKIRNGDEQ